jgi:hypothetical protein
MIPSPVPRGRAHPPPSAAASVPAGGSIGGSLLPWPLECHAQPEAIEEADGRTATRQREVSTRRGDLPDAISTPASRCVLAVDALVLRCHLAGGASGGEHAGCSTSGPSISCQCAPGYTRPRRLAPAAVAACSPPSCTHQTGRSLQGRDAQSRHA